jgi:hypothetical protein
LNGLFCGIYVAIPDPISKIRIRFPNPDPISKSRSGLGEMIMAPKQKIKKKYYVLKSLMFSLEGFFWKMLHRGSTEKYIALSPKKKIYFFPLTIFFLFLAM